MRERNWLASGVGHARTASRCVQGSSRSQVDRCWRQWSALVPHTCCSRSGDRFHRFFESILPSLKASEYRKSPVQPPPRSPREEDLWLKSIFRMIALNDPKEVKHYSSQVDALLKCIKGERTALGLPNHIVGMSTYGSELIVWQWRISGSQSQEVEATE